jgi:ATPase subunit of ABC transporter with duplicated ATPase domains
VTDPDDRAEGEARAEEIEADVAAADARRAEEERGEADEAVTEAQQKAEKLSRKERKAREKAEREAREAEAARAKAEAADADRARQVEEAAEKKRKADDDKAAAAAGPEPAGVGGDTLTSPGVGDQPEGWAAAAGTRSDAGEPTATSATSAIEGQRPEVLIGAAFAGSFLFAKLLKRLGS